ncbi:MAG: hypothetical protein J6A37_14110 [Oscillospiraceae bacterium]|nr:hypothetical protein [Oscillospiraceae bacterium]
MRENNIAMEKVNEAVAALLGGANETGVEKLRLSEKETVEIRLIRKDSLFYENRLADRLMDFERFIADTENMLGAAV